jgi:hypothetical protein
MARAVTVAGSNALTTLRSPCSPGPQDRRHGCCIAVSTPTIDRPDLATYSQLEQLAGGNAPTWDSPDIVTNYWNPFQLMPSSTVTVRNLSATAAASNVNVLFYTAPFGIGLPWQLLASQPQVALGPGQATTLSYPLPQSLLTAADQRLATYVRIIHPADTHLINNTGYQSIADAFTSVEGRSFAVTFPVCNPLATPQTLSLSVLPNMLGAVISPATYAFSPLEQIMATLAINVPAALHGTPAASVRQDATVVAYGADGGLIGGLTYVIWIDN